MKKVLFILMLLVASLTTFAQSNYDTYKSYYRNAGWYIGNEQYSNLTQGASAYTYMNFISGSTYTIVACSNDNDVTDIDLFVYLADGTLFMKDSDLSSIGLIKFTCYSTQQVKIVIKNYSSRTPNYASTIRYFIAYY